jgi:hypothetical protein
MAILQGFSCKGSLVNESLAKSACSFSPCSPGTEIYTAVFAHHVTLPAIFCSSWHVTKNTGLWHYKPMQCIQRYM